MKQVIIAFLFSLGLLALGMDGKASAPPLPGIGVVVKKNPGGGASKAVTDMDGRFTLTLEVGDYLITLDPKQLELDVAEILKANNVTVNMKPDRGNRAELSIIGKCCPTKVIAMAEKDYTYVITILQGDETIQRKLNFNLGNGTRIAQNAGKLAAIKKGGSIHYLCILCSEEFNTDDENWTMNRSVQKPNRAGQY